MEALFEGVLISDICVYSRRCKKEVKCRNEHPAWIQRLNICARYLKADHSDPCTFGSKCRNKHWTIGQIESKLQPGDEKDLFKGGGTFNPQDDRFDIDKQLKKLDIDSDSSSSKQSSSSKREKEDIEAKIKETNTQILELSTRPDSNPTIQKLIENLFDQAKSYQDKLDELLNVKKKEDRNKNFGKQDKPYHKYNQGKDKNKQDQNRAKYQKNPRDEQSDQDAKPKLKQQPYVIPSQSRIPVCLAFLGQTGSGKTTLLHALKDHIEGVSFKNRKLVAREQAKGKSQTKKSVQFSLCSGGTLVNIIDTPGLCDTELGQVDEQHLLDITNMIIKQGEFNAICFVMKGGDVRAIASLKFAINELKSMLPKNVRNNIIICVTRQPRASISQDFKGVLQDLDIDVDNVITFENSAYEELASIPTIDDLREQERDFKNTKAKLQKLIDIAAKMVPYRSEGIRVIKEKRHDIKEEIQQMMDVMDDCCNAKLQLDEYLEAIQKAILDKNLNSNYMIPTQVRRTRQVEGLEGHSTVCSCGNRCHVQCGLGFGVDLRGCWCMNGDSCGQCANRCRVENHSHTRYSSEQVYYETINVEDPNKKQAFHSAEEKFKYYTNLQNNALAKIQGEDAKIDKCQKRIKQLYVELEELAFVGFNENYEQYLLETKKAVSNDTLMKDNKKKLKISMIDKAINIYSKIKYNLFGSK